MSDHGDTIATFALHSTDLNHFCIGMYIRVPFILISTLACLDSGQDGRCSGIHYNQSTLCPP